MKYAIVNGYTIRSDFGEGVLNVADDEFSVRTPQPLYRSRRNLRFREARTWYVRLLFFSNPPTRSLIRIS